MRFLVLAISTLIVISCGTQKISIANNNKELTYQRGQKVYKTQFLLDLESDNNFTLVELDKKPEPIQGENELLVDLYKTIRYPASARENNIQGTVLLESLVNKQGEVVQVTVNKSVHPDLDNEALRAYKIAIKEGFKPFSYNGKPTQFKYIFPVKFSFH